ncbi:uracil-DNA glycosylase [Sulfurimonas sp.]|uniref:uracil-DNA glycosylase n=1 Tax=Sulfurimonas sp. TaxID=2022749 RepID=UPI002AAF0FAE|nr:uracil-DNA glycosylase [Sulfurimonas sp.]
MLSKSWSKFLYAQMQENYYKKLQCFIDKEYKEQIIYPKREDIFRAFDLIEVEKVKVVIIGQDPYHGENQANGLAFSVWDECKIPPSLKNIFKELVDDIGCEYPKSGNLTSWAKDGVLLINTVLTVQSSKANSHKAKGWELFTDFIIKELSLKHENIVFILWGNPSIKKASFIDESKHLVLKSPHPSPLSSYRGFFGSKPFSKTNEYLKQHSKEEINWCLS